MRFTANDAEKMRNSRLILGTVQMGIDYGISNKSGRISEEQAFEILKCAWESGIRVLDTAEAYGKAHEVIGNFHATYPQMSFNVITKLPADYEHSVAQKIASYLKELNLQRLDTLMFHSFDSYQNSSDIQKLNELKREGVIQKVGVSVYTNAQLEVVIDDPNIDCIQLPYNALDNRAQRGALISKAKKQGKEIHTRSCYLQGLFFMPLDSEKVIVQRLQRELNQFHSIVSESNRKIQDVALGYCVENKEIDHILIGVDSKKQLQENLDGLKEEIQKEMVNKLEQIIVEDTDLLNPSLWNRI